MPALEIRQQFSIPDRNRIGAWVRQYRKEGEAMFAGKRRRSGRKPIQENREAYIARLKMEVDLLKKIPCRVASGFTRETRYRVIENNRGKYEVKAMCEFFGISRAAYYAWREQSNEPDPDLPSLKLAQESYLASRRTYGYRRVQLWIEREYGIKINHKAVLRLMRKLGIR